MSIQTVIEDLGFALLQNAADLARVNRHIERLEKLRDALELLDAALEAMNEAIDDAGVSRVSLTDGKAALDEEMVSLLLVQKLIE